MAMTAAHGPMTIAIIVPPTAWPVVPPGRGMLNIIITNVKAAAIATSGACLELSVLLTLWPAQYQAGTTRAHIPPAVCGLR